MGGRTGTRQRPAGGGGSGDERLHACVRARCESKVRARGVRVTASRSGIGGCAARGGRASGRRGPADLECGGELGFPSWDVWPTFLWAAIRIRYFLVNSVCRGTKPNLPRFFRYLRTENRIGTDFLRFGFRSFSVRFQFSVFRAQS
jgi:hypothetical protein